MFAPICLFTYNRLSETQRTIEALKNNFLASESELFIFSDGAKSEKGVAKIAEVRDFLKTVSGFKTVQIVESPVNKGLANSIVEGVSRMIDQFGKVIVLEDDLQTSPNFLDFMNQALDFYAENPRIFSITGYSMDLPSLKNYQKDYYAGYRASSWGWGTWKNRWEKVDWKVENYQSFLFDPFAQLKFMRGGSDLPYMLWKQMNGKIDSWAVRWCYSQFRGNLLTIMPSLSKVESIGFGAEATHTKNTKRFFTSPDKTFRREFVFDEEVIPERVLVKEFRHKFSVISRLSDRF